MNKDASTYDHFLDVAAGLGHVGNHITLLARSIQRDEAELRRMQGIIDTLQAEIKELRGELEVAQREVER